MSLVVQKYGGTSLGGAALIGRVADRVAAARRAGREVVAVVSAMGSTTDELLSVAHEVSPKPRGRELDALLSTGERASAALLALGLQRRGVAACSLTGADAGITTDDEHGRARVLEVRPDRVREQLAAGRVPVVAGFQGVSRTGRDVTTLGRGGSDTTAAALAVALDAEVCEIGTDVDGVYSADPRCVPDARMLRYLPYEPMLELARGGARVLVPRCVEYAGAHGLPVRVRPADGGGDGTWIAARPPRGKRGQRGDPAERAGVWGLAHLDRQVQLTVAGLREDPDALATVFRALADADVGLDLPTWAASPDRDRRLEVSFLLPEAECERAGAALAEARSFCGFDALRRSEPMGKLTIVGTGLRSRPILLPALLQALSAAGVVVARTELTESRIAVTCPEERLLEAAIAAHEALVLGRSPFTSAPGAPGEPGGPVRAEVGK